MDDWLITPLVALLAIALSALIRFLEKKSRPQRDTYITFFVGFVALFSILVFTQAHQSWLLGMLIGMGVSYAWFFHRNARTERERA